HAVAPGAVVGRQVDASDPGGRGRRRRELPEGHAGNALVVGKLDVQILVLSDPTAHLGVVREEGNDAAEVGVFTAVAVNAEAPHGRTSRAQHREGGAGGRGGPETG